MTTASTEFRKNILDALKKKVNSQNIDLTRKIKILQKENNTIELILSNDAIGYSDDPQNMQSDSAAFEAWALILHVHLGYKILLNITELPQEDIASGHYHRFLYRVHKFSNQFKDWFDCTPELKNLVEKYQKHLTDPTLTFTNNVPDNEARYSSSKESHIEAKMVEKGSNNPLLAIAKTAGLNLSDGQIYRQLPVGLFCGNVSEETYEFTGKKSAIDLWAPTEESIAIFELKAQNKKVGIITELMFYANYMFDMFIDKSVSNCVTFNPNPNATTFRGYNHLLKSYKDVKAYFLTDVLHPLITEDVISEMNSNTFGISYGKLHYEMS